jgi:hypothetical protein
MSDSSPLVGEFASLDDSLSLSTFLGSQSELAFWFGGKVRTGRMSSLGELLAFWLEGWNGGEFQHRAHLPQMTSLRLS